MMLLGINLTMQYFGLIAFLEHLFQIHNNHRLLCLLLSLVVLKSLPINKIQLNQINCW